MLPDATEGAAEGEEVVAMSEAPPDLAMFGWRLSNDIVKRKTDKYGKAGETGKMLVRYATVDDLKTYKPRPEGMDPPKKRRSSGKRRHRNDREKSSRRRLNRTGGAQAGQGLTAE